MDDALVVAFAMDVDGAATVVVAIHDDDDVVDVAVVSDATVVS